MSLGLASCRDLTLTPPPAPEAPRLSQHLVTTPALPTVASGDHFCLVVYPYAPGGTIPQRVDVRFPRAAVAADNATREYSYFGYREAGKLDRAAYCRIPATEMALQVVHRQLGFPAEALRPERRRQQGSDGSAIQTIILPPLTVTACQYGGTYPNCEAPPREGPPDQSDPGAGGGGSGGSGPGAGPSDPGEHGDDPFEAGPLAWVACVGAGLTLLGSTGISLIMLHDYYDAVEASNSARIAFEWSKPENHNERYSQWQAAQDEVRRQALLLAASGVVSVGAILLVAAACSPTVLFPTP